jgi:hypothetical protein
MSDSGNLAAEAIKYGIKSIVLGALVLGLIIGAILGLGVFGIFYFLF